MATQGVKLATKVSILGNLCDELQHKIYCNNFSNQQNLDSIQAKLTNLESILDQFSKLVVKKNQYVDYQWQDQSS